MHELYALKNEIKAHNEIVSSPNRIYCFQNNASECDTESNPCWGSGTETNNCIQCAAHSGLPPQWWSIFLVINCVRQSLRYHQMHLHKLAWFNTFSPLRYQWVLAVSLQCQWQRCLDQWSLQYDPTSQDWADTRRNTETLNTCEHLNVENFAMTL